LRNSAARAPSAISLSLVIEYHREDDGPLAGRSPGVALWQATPYVEALALRLIADGIEQWDCRQQVGPLKTKMPGAVFIRPGLLVTS
jgi:hypothetical protein